MDDLKKELRASSYLAFEDGTNDYGTAPEAADRIEQLDAKLTLAIAALKQSRDELDMYSWTEYPGDHPVQARYRQRDYDANPARIALVELGVKE